MEKQEPLLVHLREARTQFETAKEKSFKAHFYTLLLLCVVTRIMAGYDLGFLNEILSRGYLENVSAGFLTGAIIFWALDRSFARQQTLSSFHIAMLDRFTSAAILQARDNKNLGLEKKLMARSLRTLQQGALKENLWVRHQYQQAGLDMLKEVLKIVRGSLSDGAEIIANYRAAHGMAVERGYFEIADMLLENINIVQGTIEDTERTHRIVEEKINELSTDLDAWLAEWQAKSTHS